jgi:hypothetical protein
MKLLFILFSIINANPLNCDSILTEIRAAKYKCDCQATEWLIFTGDGIDQRNHKLKPNSNNERLNFYFDNYKQVLETKVRLMILESQVTYKCTH